MAAVECIALHANFHWESSSFGSVSATAPKVMGSILAFPQCTNVPVISANIAVCMKQRFFFFWELHSSYTVIIQ